MMMMMMMRGLFFSNSTAQRTPQNSLIRDGINADGFAAQERTKDHKKRAMSALSVVRLFFFFQYECSTSVSEERATVCE